MLESVKVSIGKPSKESLPVKSLSGSPFELTAVSESTAAEVTSFAKPVEIQVRYSEAGMTSEEDLRLYWYDPADGYWKLALNQHVDIENNMLYGVRGPLHGLRRIQLQLADRGRRPP